MLVTDVIMPGIDGPTWVLEARRDRPDVGVIFMSGYAEEANKRSENIGARRLYTIMEALLEGLSYDASERSESKFLVNVDYVKSTLDPILADEDLAKYIL